MGAFAMDPKGFHAQQIQQHLARQLGDRILPGGDIFENSPHVEESKKIGLKNPSDSMTSQARKPKFKPQPAQKPKSASTSRPERKSNLGSVGTRRGGGSGPSVTGLQGISLNKKTLLGE